jgi:hypothetical protein
MRSFILIVLALLFALCLAHKTPRTVEEIEVQRRLQSAAYHARLSLFRVGSVR